MWFILTFGCRIMRSRTQEFCVGLFMWFGLFRSQSAVCWSSLCKIPHYVFQLKAPLCVCLCMITMSCWWQTLWIWVQGLRAGDAERIPGVVLREWETWCTDDFGPDTPADAERCNPHLHLILFISSPSSFHLRFKRNTVHVCYARRD